MKRHLTMLAAVLVLGVAAVGTASAHSSVGISIGVPIPGVAYGPPTVAAPPDAYYGAPYASYPYASYPYYYPGPVVYGYYGSYGHPYGHYRYWHR